jgi:formylglycine-generating enzyme required for sulfatase activity
MKPRYISPLLALLLLFSFTNANAKGSGIKVHCEEENVGAEITINGVFKGECPLVIEVEPGRLTFRAFKSDSNYDYVFEQDIRMGDGALKDIYVVLEKRLNAAGQRAENARLATEREAAAREEAQQQETLRRQREAQLSERAAFIAKGPEMVAIPGKNYELGKYEVTQAEWRAIMGSNPSKIHCEPRTITNCSSDKNPVDSVSWRDDIPEFLQKLNAQTGKQYRLPTEAEWEYACYGGQGSFFSTPAYCGGDNLDAVGWYDGNSGGKSHPVGQKQANGYGLYDMSGNVWEWMSNCYDSSCDGRSGRGGSWNNDSSIARAANRNFGPTDMTVHIGFRLARTLP